MVENRMMTIKEYKDANPGKKVKTAYAKYKKQWKKDHPTEEEISSAAEPAKAEDAQTDKPHDNRENVKLNASAPEIRGEAIPSPSNSKGGENVEAIDKILEIGKKTVNDALMKSAEATEAPKVDLATALKTVRQQNKNLAATFCEISTSGDSKAVLKFQKLLFVYEDMITELCDAMEMLIARDKMAIAEFENMRYNQEELRENVKKRKEKGVG